MSLITSSLQCHRSPREPNAAAMSSFKGEMARHISDATISYRKKASSVALAMRADATVGVAEDAVVRFFLGQGETAVVLEPGSLSEHVNDPFAKERGSPSGQKRLTGKSGSTFCVL